TVSVDRKGPASSGVRSQPHPHSGGSRAMRGAALAAMHLELADLALATRADGSSSALAPRDAALLAWLALEGPTPRAQLAELLWPLSDPVAARNTLRQRLFHLKRHCGELVAGAT